MSLITSIREASRRRAAYRRTLFDLQGVPTSLAEGIGIFPGDARSLAREAVYG